MPKGRKGFQKGIDNPEWMGNEVGYRSLHAWVSRTLGKPNRCQECRTTEVPSGMRGYFQWANISGHYLRIVEDWKRLCKKCHVRFDRKGHLNRKVGRNNTSGHTGVDWHRSNGKWQSRAYINGKRIRLGYFRTKEEAVRARNNINRQ